ncbi:hypothetical protein M8818_004125 [Zalaria obscura]|uniref:Uncharacterized protein n=1 Tax=Zalaria obscura TaxID=2024903 RepID=A0ACC3SCD1_9PEZI
MVLPNSGHWMLFVSGVAERRAKLLSASPPFESLMLHAVPPSFSPAAYNSPTRKVTRLRSKSHTCKHLSWALVDLYSRLWGSLGPA